MTLKVITYPLYVVALAGCSTATSPEPPAPVPAAPAPVTTNAEAIARARADSARLPYTEADVRFMTMMVGHHAQAVQVAGWAASHGASAAVQRLAERIVNGQQDEITLMQQWLADRQKPVPVADHAMHHQQHMPGMLTEEQLRQLDAARGTEFDRLFLTLMIAHHRGAVSMAQELFRTPGAAQDQQVFRFASDVNVDQTTEIARMEQMLAALNSN
jgi:uncharacterized protein (DUF305 family)